MRFARVVFAIAGVWGVLIMTPLYFTIDAVGRAYPPPITHPDLYYGFIGVTLAWQIAFLRSPRTPCGIERSCSLEFLKSSCTSAR